jgi:ubiquinone/menaquinone biosynthesis C-methylase UbiE
MVSTSRRSSLDLVRESAALAWLFLNPVKTRPQAIYDILSTHNNLGESSLFLNLGYWRDAHTYDEACAALVRRVGQRAGLGPEDDVLDAGFGFGDQHLLWMKEMRPRFITGVNITASQVFYAKERIERLGLTDRIELYVASATDLPFEDARFTKVVSVEAAFHFDTRERFFAEAFRVLAPGGRIVLADVVPGARWQESAAPVRWATEFVGRSFWQYPHENIYPLGTYVETMRRAGFEGLQIEDISDDVFEPFNRYARQRVKHPVVRARVNPILRTFWSVELGGRGKRLLDYVIISARKGR